jgi:hypothetical protein
MLVTAMMSRLREPRLHLGPASRGATKCLGVRIVWPLRELPPLYRKPVPYRSMVPLPAAHQVVAHGRRPLVLARSGGVGAHRSPFAFSGDANQHREILKWELRSTPDAANVLTSWSNDVGGFMCNNINQTDCSGDPKLLSNGILYLRWLQVRGGGAVRGGGGSLCLMCAYVIERRLRRLGLPTARTPQSGTLQSWRGVSGSSQPSFLDP